MPKPHSHLPLFSCREFRAHHKQCLLVERAFRKKKDIHETVNKIEAVKIPPARPKSKIIIKASGAEQTTGTSKAILPTYYKPVITNYITLQKVLAIQLAPSTSGAAIGSTAERTAPTAGTTSLPTS